MIELSKNFIGNNNLINNLLKSYHDENLPNSIIFSGPKGIGKATASFYFVNELFNKVEKKNINLIYNNSHPNFRYISKITDIKNNKIKKNISIEQIRSLGNFLNQSSFNTLPKFVIIDSADDMNNNSANSLLKSLEEPKLNTFFILISHQFSTLLPTIRSRCVNYRIEKPSYKQFSEILNINDSLIETSDIDFLYEVTNGSSGLALEIYTKDFKDTYNSIIDIFINKESHIFETQKLSNIIGNYSDDEFKIFLILLRFIILSIIKINLGYYNNHKFLSKSIESLFFTAKIIPNKISIEILDFIDENEKDLFIYNLDKKIFCFNIFSPLVKKYE